MSQPVLLKVYANLAPADAILADRLNALCAQCCPEPEAPPCLVTGDLLTLAYEGIYCPVEEIVAAIRGALRGEEQGKLDELDLELWRLTRYIFAQGQVTTSSAPLNNVLDYSASPWF